MANGPRYQLLTDELAERIAEDIENHGQYLFLTESPTFRGRWEVEGLLPQWFWTFEDLVGSFRTLSPARLESFLDCAEEGNYQVIFSEPPEGILGAYKRLSEPPPFSLRSELPGTDYGFYPWQIECFNKLIRDESLDMGLIVHGTGLGKTCLIIAALLWHESHGHPYDLGFVIVKANNKIDMQRKLMRLGGIESIILDGTPKQREKIYDEIAARLKLHQKTVVVTNYEKFREDSDFLSALVSDIDLLFFFDEMPTRLSNRTTMLYKAMRKCLWKRFESRNEGLKGAIPRAKWMRLWELSATPIENSPEGLFNCIRLMNPALLGRVEEFYSEYVAYVHPFSFKPERWKNLDKLEARIEHITHRASREDSEVALLFPKVVEDTLFIDWHPKDRRIYDLMTGKAIEILNNEVEAFEDVNILALIQMMQMMCDAPSMINESAKNREALMANLTEADSMFSSIGPIGSELAVKLMEIIKNPLTNEQHTKLATLKEILLEKHPNDKMLIFMTWGSYGFPPLIDALNEWGISHVVYQGTDKEATAAKDRFREDPEIRVFLSSDRGADSIDLPEAAIGINYNLPWTWVRKRQRMRNVRVDSELPFNYWYDLIMSNSIEERKQEIIEQKAGYHSALFDGKAIEETISSKISRQELLYILEGS